MEYLLNNESELAGVAGEVAEALLSQPLRKRATVLALIGELGAGKTTFSKHFLKFLGVTEQIVSPTFVIIKSYVLSTKYYELAHHIDTYRLEEPVAELKKLEIEKVLDDPKHLVLIEWADRVEELLPPDAIRLEFSHEDGNKRSLKVSGMDL